MNDKPVEVVEEVKEEAKPVELSALEPVDKFAKFKASGKLASLWKGKAGAGVGFSGGFSGSVLSGKQSPLAIGNGKDLWGLQGKSAKEKFMV